ncbi:MAG: PVC-type heme-binding CxxCH protein [Verrucomicrobiota bacterium]
MSSIAYAWRYHSSIVKLLARHGFNATVLFSLAPDGTVDPENGGHLSHSVALETADAIVMSLRFRHWDDESMQRFEDALNRGVPMVALRTSTHPFNFPDDSKWAKYSWRASPELGWENGFGRQVIGETWVSHWGKHKVEGCRTHVEPGQEDHPILNGVGEIFCTSDVYEASPLEPSTILLRGEVTASFDPDSEGVEGKNDPMQPVVWTREFENEGEKKNRIVTNTMGASTDLLDPDLRRLVINSVFWGLELEVLEEANVDVTGYDPSFYSFKAFKVGLKPEDFIPGAEKFKDAPLFNELPENQPEKKKGKGKGEKKAKAKSEPKKAANQPKGKAKPDAEPELPPKVIPPLNPESVPFVKGEVPERLVAEEGDSIVIIGAGMASRMNHFGHFETEIFLRHPAQDITIRNMGDEGNTPGFRPHPGRNQDQQYAFPGAKELLPLELQAPSKPVGHFETPDQWLTRLGADTILAFFGFNSSFGGPADVGRFEAELEAFIQHTLSQKYNGETVPQLALISPSAYQDISDQFSVPDGVQENENLALYSAAMKKVCAANGVLFVDAFELSKDVLEGADTIDGCLLTDSGYQKLAPILADQLFGEAGDISGDRTAVHAAVMEKNWAWLNNFKIPNGVHVYGRRYNPYGPENYPYELAKTREYTANRDQAIWAVLQGEAFDLAAADAETSPLPPVPTNYKPPTENEKNGTVDYQAPGVTESLIQVADGYQIELFASEQSFPDLKNPVQLAFDNQGRLWVATMESYPHYRIGDPRPKDKLIILEDRDKDGVADHQITFADDLHIPIGFEISHDGVYVSQSGSLVRLRDEDGDDQYDTYEVMLSGFDDHDTHHAISSFCADPSGAFVMSEGVFLHSNTESAYGPSRGTNGGFFRYSPQRKHIVRYSQFSIPNPWGMAFDDYGQDFFLHTSGPKLSWMLPGTLKARYGANLQAPDLLTSNQVRPTSGIEFVSSRHFPEDVQGDILINNNIGFLGAKQHRPSEDGTGFTTEFVQDLFVSDDRNFRPTDLEFAPDGSLYVVDWHNALIGHMQHNARDPNRDHTHGRIFRVTYPDRPLVDPPVIDGAPIADLLENLKLHESRARYRTRRELREHDGMTVAKAARDWAAQQADERLKLEALWVTWGADQVDQELLSELLNSNDHRIRSAAVRVARFNEHQIGNLSDLLLQAAADDHGRVRLEAITAATYLPVDTARAIVETAKAKGVDDYTAQTIKFAEDLFAGAAIKEEEKGKEKLPSGITEDTPQRTTVQINCIVEGLKFDVKKVELEAGKKVRLIFNNPDVMQHNLVVVKPGTADAVAMAAMTMGAEGFAKQFLPETEEIITATKLLNANEEETIEFTLDQPGTYPYVCTFPGHAVLMRGEFIVK